MNTALSLPGLGVAAVSHCGVCGRTLTDPVSVAAGIGPVCAHKHGADDGFEQRDELDPFDAETMDITCRRDARGTAIFNIPQRHKHHSPNGMEFGYAGSGPADFALNVLALFLPVRSSSGVDLWDGTQVSIEAYTLHQDFKRSFIESMPRNGATIPGAMIREWIERRAEEES